MRRNGLVIGIVLVAVVLAAGLWLLWSRRGDTGAAAQDVEEREPERASEPQRGVAPPTSAAEGSRAPETPTPAQAGTAPVGRSTSDEAARRVRLERSIRAAREARLRWQAEHASSTSTAAPPEADAATAPGLDAAYIRDRVQELRPLLAECYELALHEDPALAGSLIVEFVIGGEPEVGGIVEDSRIDDASTLRHPVLDECVRETMYMAEFTAPAEGGQVTVRYPFRFAQAADAGGSESRYRDF
jgi:hypothetical protein